MADEGDEGDEGNGVQALVVDNGSGMCKVLSDKTNSCKHFEYIKECVCVPCVAFERLNNNRRALLETMHHERCFRRSWVALVTKVV